MDFSKKNVDFFGKKWNEKQLKVEKSNLHFFSGCVRTFKLFYPN